MNSPFSEDSHAFGKYAWGLGQAKGNSDIDNADHYKSQKLSVSQQNHHMEVGVLQIKGSKPVVLSQHGEDCLKGDHAELHVFDVLIETLDIENRSHPSHRLGDQEIPFPRQPVPKWQRCGRKIYE